AGDEMVILEHRAAVTDGTWRLKGIFQGRLRISTSWSGSQTVASSSLLGANGAQNRSITSPK
ncbi:hypothetical protein, partial [Xanthomonas fragariae]|uniref:hypothetical protein n=1 Tax=Xanthomonas fragariae TaxID=48664 RepID=UPI001F1DA9A3